MGVHSLGRHDHGEGRILHAIQLSAVRMGVWTLMLAFFSRLSY
jgi:hypothetical protein